MEPKFQTSFIPKKSIVEMSGNEDNRVHSINIFSTIGTVVFIITLIASGGVFIYKNFLINQIIQSDKDLNSARQAFQLEAIANITDASSRIMATKNLLEKHIVVSELLTLLQALTVKKLRFTSLIYSNKDNLTSLAMEVEAKDYNALAVQSDIFSKNEFIKNPNFSEFGLIDNGDIKTKFSSSLDPQLVSYKRAVESLSLTN